MTELAFDLVGGQVLYPDGLRQGTLSFAEGRIAGDLSGRRVDLAGYMVLPGIVDVHGDGFERHLAPRRGAMKDMAEGLVSTEAELAANGITTGVLAQFYSWEGGLRGPEFAARMFEALAQVRDTFDTDMRAQLRFETHLLEEYADLPDRIAAWQVPYVVFNDHLPHERLAAGKRPPRVTGQALKAGRNPEAHLAFLQDLHARHAEVPEALDRLCAVLRQRGIRMGSHDDATAPDRAAWRERGARIAEFPETVEAAEVARAGGDHIVLGAPNVVRGGSHKGNVSGLDLIAMGLCDALASDYHYPSPRRAALMLARAGVCDMHRAWGLVSEGPARILGLEDRGILAPGKRADMVVLDAASGRVAATLARGRFTYMSGAVAARFMPACG